MSNQPEPASRTDYYYVQGRQIRLETEDDVFAVSFRAGVRADNPSLGTSSKRMLTEGAEPLTFIPHYNLHIYRAGGAEPAAAAPGAVRSVRDAVATLDDEPAVEFAAMAVRRMGGEDNVSFLTRRFLAAFKPEVSQDRIDELLRRIGAEIVDKLGYVANGYLLNAPDAEGANGPVALANTCFESGLCEFAHPDFIERRQWRGIAAKDGTESNRRDTATDQRAARDAAFLDRQWHLKTAKVLDAWNVTRGSSSITIGLLDDGVDTGHPEFSSKLGPQFDFQTNSADGSPKLADDKHGTACAGVAAAAGVMASGVAPACRLMAVRTPSMLGVADEANMFRWAADNGADVISCSWGPADNAGPFSLVDNVRAAMHYCLTDGRGGKGIPIFFAAGNGNELVSDDGYASNPDVMAIAASSIRDTRSPYSDFGPEIFIAAPSSGDSAAGDPRIFTTDRRAAQGYNTGDVSLGDAAGDYTSRFGGTSSACPLVAGTAALLLSVDPSLTRDQVRETLKSTADKVGSGYDAAGHSSEFGYGRVNALAAVQAVQGGSGGGQTSANPTISAPASANGTSPPTFTVDLGNRRLYAVELTCRRELLDSANAGERTSDNYFGSWTQGLVSTPTYQPPADVWSALAASATQIFYLGHFADDASWSNYMVSNTVEDAPSIQLEGSSGGSGSPSTTTGPALTAPDSAAADKAPEFEVTLGDRRLYAVELATRPELFDSANSDQQTDDNHYGSWVEGLRSDSPYVPPESVWSTLAASGQVYYLGHFADDNAWANYVEWGDPADPPSIAIGDASDRSDRPARLAARSNEAETDEQPSIAGPVTIERQGTAPEFHIRTGANRYFAVEIASSAELLRADSREQRTPETFYASWGDPSVGLTQAPAGQPTVFALPDAAWTKLRKHQSLYYRILTASQGSGWPDLVVSIADDRSSEAPRIRIVDARSARADDSSAAPAAASFLMSHDTDAREWEAAL